MQAEHEDLSQAHSELQAAQQALQNDTAELRAQHSDSEAKIGELQASQSGLQSLYSQLEAEHDSSGQANSKLQLQHSTLSDAHRQLQKQFQDLSAASEEVQCELQAAVTKEAEGAAAYVLLQEQHQGLRAEKVTTETNLAATQVQLTAASAAKVLACLFTCISCPVS